jgi:mannose-6-phosphate isomerase-like protein (cupin superfamily)
MSYTKKNLNEVEDSAPKFGFGEIGEARFAMGELGAEQTGLAFHKLKPGIRQAFSHTHEEAEEVYVVLAGSGRIKLDEEIVEIGPLDAIRIAPTVERQLEAGEEGIEYLAFGPHYKGDGELNHSGDFWG